MHYDKDSYLRGLMSLAIVSTPLLGCATAEPPTELVDARAAYTRAQSGYATQLTPAELHSAKVALDSAERSFKDDGASSKTRDEAYIAMRKAQLAETSGTTEHYKRELTAAKQREEREQANAAANARQQLAQAQEQLSQAQAERAEAQKRADEAMDKLKSANTAQVKQDAHRTVISLPGNVLFASGKATITPAAQTNLTQVADALKQQTQATLRVEGHTDSTGSDSKNLALSKQRAQAVSAFLVDHGVPQDRLTIEGLGSSQPIADNSTPAGRAMNRRVDIVVENAASSTPQR